MPYDLTIAIPTLVGSLLSFVATSAVLVSYIVYADQQRSFRHALVLNLALAGKSPRQTIYMSELIMYTRIHQLAE
jgi:hypothetical protein